MARILKRPPKKHRILDDQEFREKDSKGIDIKYLKSIRREELDRTKKLKRNPKGFLRVDFEKIGNPEKLEDGLSIDFDPKSDGFARAQKVLSKPPQSRERRRLVRALGLAFAETYARYRAAAGREIGKTVRWVPIGKDMVYAQSAAVACIAKGVTPRQVLEYWHENIKTFADGSMVVPPLTLLSNAGMIDSVACSLIGDKPKKKRRKPKPTPKNSFADTDELDRRLRPALTEAGFDVQSYNDRFLMSVQSTAKTLLGGEEVFVSSKMRPMVDVAMKVIHEN